MHNTRIVKRIGAAVRLFEKTLVEVNGIFMACSVFLVIVLYDCILSGENKPWKPGLWPWKIVVVTPIRLRVWTSISCRGHVRECVAVFWYFHGLFSVLIFSLI